MSSSAWSVALLGMQATLVEVEAAIGGGLPRTVLVGLPDTALYEARDRCRAAVASSGGSWPNQLLTINLTPATLPKGGSHYDIAIVAAVLAAQGTVPEHGTRGVVMMGELGLDGRVRAVSGVLPALLAARRAGFSRAVVPASQVREAELVKGLEIWGIATLADLGEVLHGRPVTLPEQGQPVAHPGAKVPPDLRDVVGQPEARWALEVAAAGRHHLLLHGPPGVGKTMLAERLPGVLPELSEAEALDVSAVHSLAGALGDGLIKRPPYVDPHHSSSLAALIGGGARVARPGAISLSHLGVLFLDEAPEFSPRALEALRTPLESGWIVIGRAQTQVRFPARFQLVLAANPCPCGHAGSASALCTCTPMAVRRYCERLSGPILDRIDIGVHLLPLSRADLGVDHEGGESSAVVADRVRMARDRQAHRLATTEWSTNGQVPGPYLRRELPLPQGTDLIDRALVRGQLSLRGVDKVLRVAWTLADLEGRGVPSDADVQAALAWRQSGMRSVTA